MSERLLDAIAKCSQKSKDSLAEFLSGLMAKEDVQPKNPTLAKLSQLFDEQTRSFTISKARQVSKGERSKKFLIGHEFNYGEITFETVYTVFQKIGDFRPIKEQQIFYDLGSGTGKVVLAAAMCYPFSKCFGIQYLQSLCTFSQTLKEQISSKQQKIEEEMHECGSKVHQLPPISFLNADFKEIDWSDGTIIFVSSTCYSRQIMSQIEKLCYKLSPGTIIVTLTRKLEEAQGVKLMLSIEGSTSWGNATIFIHMKHS